MTSYILKIYFYNILLQLTFSHISLIFFGHLIHTPYLSHNRRKVIEKVRRNIICLFNMLEIDSFKTTLDHIDRI